MWWTVSRRRAEAPGGPDLLRPDHELLAQFEAAVRFSETVVGMRRTSHQYTAGQAATLTWLVERGPAPLTFGPTAAGRPDPADVRRLRRWAREILDAPEDRAPFPMAYVVGVDYVCRWALGDVDATPIPVRAREPGGQDTLARPAAAQRSAPPFRPAAPG